MKISKSKLVLAALTLSTSFLTNANTAVPHCAEAVGVTIDELKYQNVYVNGNPKKLLYINVGAANVTNKAACNTNSGYQFVEVADDDPDNELRLTLLIKAYENQTPVHLRGNCYCVTSQGALDAERINMIKYQ